jgi:hypothetical protein
VARHHDVRRIDAALGHRRDDRAEPRRIDVLQGQRA